MTFALTYVALLTVANFYLLTRPAPGRGAIAALAVMYVLGGYVGTHALWFGGMFGGAAEAFASVEYLMTEYTWQFAYRQYALPAFALLFLVQALLARWLRRGETHAST